MRLASSVATLSRRGETCEASEGSRFVAITAALPYRQRIRAGRCKQLVSQVQSHSHGPERLRERSTCLIPGVGCDWVAADTSDDSHAGSPYGHAECCACAPQDMKTWEFIRQMEFRTRCWWRPTERDRPGGKDRKHKQSQADCPVRTTEGNGISHAESATGATIGCARILLRLPCRRRCLAVLLLARSLELRSGEVSQRRCIGAGPIPRSMHVPTIFRCRTCGWTGPGEREAGFRRPHPLRRPLR